MMQINPRKKEQRNSGHVLSHRLTDRQIIIDAMKLAGEHLFVQNTNICPEHSSVK